MHKGSASEVETELIIAYRLNYLRKEDFEKLVLALDENRKIDIPAFNYLKDKLKKE
jgi:four helix bundle protein